MEGTPLIPMSNSSSAIGWCRARLEYYKQLTKQFAGRAPDELHYDISGVVETGRSDFFLMVLMQRGP